MRVSLVMTVLNEAGSLPAVLETLLAQRRQADEIIVVDGGSQDATVEILRASRAYLPLTVLEAPGVNIARGRNLAIAAATGDVIAVTDAGVRLPAEWLAHLVAPFADPAVTHVAGFFRSDPRTTFEVALGAATLPEVAEIEPATFIPSSRSVAFCRAIWEDAGGYPEWLDYCEDVIFDLAVMHRHGPFRFMPQACVEFRPRPTLGAFFRQYYRYARGDGKADLFWRRHLVRYATYLVGLPALLWAAVALSPVWLLAGLAAGLIYLRRPLARLEPFLQSAPWPERFRALAWLPMIVASGDLAKMLGYPAGVRWRLGRQTDRRADS
jgi:glycosyltransferase involved in cell wall biosynthesis